MTHLNSRLASTVLEALELNLASSNGSKSVTFLNAIAPNRAAIASVSLPTEFKRSSGLVSISVFDIANGVGE